MSEPQMMESTGKVYIEEFSSGEILQADLEILGALLVSVLYFTMNEIVWKNTARDLEVAKYVAAYGSSDWYTLARAIKYYGGLAITATALIFHIIAMFGVLNSINMIIFDWVMGLAYPLTLVTALTFFFLQEEQNYAEVSKTTPVAANVTAANMMHQLTASEVGGFIAIYAGYVIAWGKNQKAWKYGQEVAMEEDPVMEEEAAVEEEIAVEEEALAGEGEEAAVATEEEPVIFA